MLRLEGIVKRFGKTVAVDGLDLHVHVGEVFGLLGPNGAGKSTSIAIATGLLSPDAGTVTVNGAGAPDHAEVRRLIGLATQQISLYEDLSAEENLEFFGRLYGIERTLRRRRAGQLLDRVGLTTRGTDRVSGYSGGMKRRLNLAAALMHDPPLVLLDEPTAGVDPHSRSALLDLVGSLKRDGKTVVYTTHYMEEAQRVCDRAAIIDHGRSLAVGRVDELIAAHGGRSVLTIERVESSERIETDDPMREIARHANAEGVIEVRLERPDLESVFLTLTGRSLRD
ncbi:MAG: ABC transporter ATP-binding protein [Planctomycetota bacterium]